MRLIESNDNDQTVTVQLTLAEVRDLHSALFDAMSALDKEPPVLRALLSECEGLDEPEDIQELIHNAGREEETVEELQKVLKRKEQLLPKVHDFLGALQRMLP
jgi:hypothetical protein